MKMLNYKVDWHSLLKKGIPTLDDNFGTYLISGYQGSDKTYYAFYTMESTLNFPQDMSFYSWLQQSRKHKRYVYMKGEKNENVKL